MSSFASQDLFSSGPHRFHVGGLSLRHVLQETPGTRGVQVSALGQRGRAITQTGELRADSADQLREFSDAIEALLDGVAYELVDDLGRTWPHVVMLSFEPQRPRRLGPRFALAYRIQYLQVTP